MTMKELNDLEAAVEREIFCSACLDPITYGIEKAMFDQQRWKKLLGAVKQFDEEGKAARIEHWTRQLEAARQSQLHLERLRDELRPQPRVVFGRKKWGISP